MERYSRVETYEPAPWMGLDGKIGYHWTNAGNARLGTRKRGDLVWVWRRWIDGTWIGYWYRRRDVRLLD